MKNIAGLGKKRMLSAVAIAILLPVLSIASISCGSGNKVLINSPYDFSARWRTIMAPHCHTTSSDGRMSPTAAIDTYASLGFGALAITDHNETTWPWPVNPPGMTPVEGDEVSAYRSLENYHITSLFCGYVPTPTVTPQECLDGVRSLGGLAVICHPKVSGKSAADIAKLNGYDGIEIYNRSTELITNKGYSVDVWDGLLASGRLVWGFAADDWHGNPDGIAWGKIMVLPTVVNSESIKDAVKKGNFYSIVGSGKLRFSDISVSGAKVTAATTEPADISFIGRGGEVLKSFEKTQRAAYEAVGDEIYVRIEAVSADGATTIYSNPSSVKISAL